ncbi:cation diffusion facilitator family transporter [Haladaptatus sp. F3-133]|jgi:cation diffusion facilitator family transporter|uniref:Cation diffusion facilitator family transporter n=1 Tax=Halorutilus salinus TaxID=2487751 RepID=A0A9Q4C5I5_9EURY|nr:cation diffusion facilitator family transporter [Halorutilus salinus]MCX2819452.1 cation diffusion facilitator family transporter [Halorutilus salinus]
MKATDDRKEFERASWVNVAGNATKVVVEGAVGVVFGSLALVADAAHSVADLVASVVVLVYGGASYDEADATHPHGHGRLEPLAALFVGAVVALLGLTLLYESILGVVRGPDVDVEGWRLMLATLGFALVSMYAVYRYTVRVNDRIGSTALHALARDCMNDVYTSVAAAVGVVGVALGHPILDPFAGGLVSVLVVYQGVEIGRENVDYLVGSAPTEGKQEEIHDAAVSHPEVRGVHDFKAFYEGTEIEVEMHAEIDGEHTVYEAHDIESEVVDRVRAVEDVGDVHVHLDPAGIGEWSDEG